MTQYLGCLSSRLLGRATAIAAATCLIATLNGLVGCDRKANPSVSIETVASSESKPLRIVALLPFAADQLLELGITPVAVPKLREDIPPAWDGIPTIAVEHSAGPNLEQLMAADPDIVITSSVYAQFLPMIERSTDARIVLMDVDSVAHVIAHIETLGELSGHTDAATSRIESLASQLEQTDNDAPKVEVLAIFGTPDRKSVV